MRLKIFEHLPFNLSRVSWPVKLITIVLLVYSTGWAMVSPFLPIYLKELFTSYSNVGIVTGALSIFSLIWSLLLGPLLNKIEKRKIISGILVFYLPFSYILLQATSFFNFLVFRFYNSFLATSLWLSSETYVREHSAKDLEAESFGMFDGFTGIPYVFGPILGGVLLGALGYDMFYAISIFAFFALLLALTLPDHGRPIKDGYLFIKPRLIIKEFMDYFADNEITSLSLFIFIFGVASSFVGMTLPLFLNYKGASMILIGAMYGFYNIPYLFEPYLLTFKNKRMLTYSGVICAIIFSTGLVFAKSLISIFLLSTLLSIAFVVVYPVVFGKFTKLMPKKRIGEFSAVNFAIRQFAAGIGPIAAGFIADAYGLESIFIFSTGMLLMLLFIFPKEL